MYVFIGNLMANGRISRELRLSIYRDSHFCDDFSPFNHYSVITARPHWEHSKARISQATVALGERKGTKLEPQSIWE